MSKQYVDREKVLESLLYIIDNGTEDVWRSLKLFFYAEKIHMEKFGQPITGDVFIAMEKGPVPSLAYDLIKVVQGKNVPHASDIATLNPGEAFSSTGKIKLTPKRAANLDVLSESAIEALNESIEVYGKLSDEALSEKAHSEECYINTPINKEIDAIDYLNWLNLTPELREYILS